MNLQQPLFHRDGGFGGAQSGDEILVEILDSGAIKITTDPISGPNHSSAENLLKTIGDICAGAVTRVRKRLTKIGHKITQHQHLKS